MSKEDDKSSAHKKILKRTKKLFTPEERDIASVAKVPDKPLEAANHEDDDEGKAT